MQAHVQQCMGQELVCRAVANQKQMGCRLMGMHPPNMQCLELHTQLLEQSELSTNHLGLWLAGQLKG